ncbi:unnamed protein product [Caenorhabditis auriculariae]|uniref:Uncharacterized protein n=1 Tax=Caenorhabditis auriculariae TaxID=2777116 RepID=A0A8S1HN53_9PELO|nr:unnamed protein product [Caenorhabditis auriculariae]
MTAFPKTFIFATATAAYQVEGGYDDDGRGRSTWDEIREESGRIADGSDPRLSCDARHKYKEDVQILKQLNVTHYRFSISWSRVFSDGTATSLNEPGIGYYRALCEELVANGILPIVTLFHTDLPLEIFDKGSWLNTETIHNFVSLCEVCFERLGDLVPYWITFNEIGHQAWYAVAKFDNLPWHCPNRPQPQEDAEKNTVSVTAHNMLLAHAQVYRLYEEKFKVFQKGQVGITNSGRWCVPNSESPEDKEACGRALDWNLNWTIEPILKDDYPRTMRQRLPWLPTFNEEQRRLLKNSIDFLGINYYISTTIKTLKKSEDGPSIFERHAGYDYGKERWDKICGETWIRNAPDGLQQLLNYLKDNFDNLPVLITENGCMDRLDAEGDPLKDDYRVVYLSDHLTLRNGCNVIGFTAWSLMDNFEWDDGFSYRFGLFRVDFVSPSKPRVIKKSGK